MSSLKLRVDKYIDSDGGDPPEVSARIYAVDPAATGQRMTRSVRRELIPISQVAGASREIPMVPGHYFVEVALPSGELLTDQVDVPAAGQAELVLRASSSPHEWLGWQHLAGNVPSYAVPRMTPAARPPARARPLPSASDAPRKRAVKGVKLGATVAKAPIEVQFSGAATGQKGVANARTAAATEALNLVELRKPLPALCGQGDVWQALRSAAGSPQDAMAMLNSGTNPVAVPVIVEDSGRAIYRVVGGVPGSASATPLQSAAPRNFLAVPRNASLELISLPTPWRVLRQGRDAVIEVAIQRSATGSEFVSSVAVRDQQLAVVLGFLSNGALGAAMGQIESALDLLFGKVENPFAAAAGGYALVGMMSDPQTKPWHAWIKNLCDLYPQLPDGSIQLAQLHLSMRRNSSDLKEAAKLFKQGYNRGLPFYTMGVRWLLDGLETVGIRDTEAADMARRVRHVASRIHPLSPFTIVRIESR